MRVVAGLLLLIGLSAAAEAQEIRGIYAGVAAGYFGYDEDGDNLGAPISEHASAYRVLAGYQFNSVYGLEVSWGKTQRFTEHLRGFDTSGGPVALDIGGEYEIKALRFVAFAPFSNFGMFGGGGYYDATLDASYRFRTSTDISTGTTQDTDNGLTAFGGIQYEFERIAVRGEYEWFDAADGVNIQSVNVAAIFRF